MKWFGSTLLILALFAVLGAAPAAACDDKDCEKCSEKDRDRDDDRRRDDDDRNRDEHRREISHSDREIRLPCPDVRPCGRHAGTCSRLPQHPWFTEAGLQSFMAVFTHAATQGVENATIRAFNSSQVAPPCEPKK